MRPSRVSRSAPLTFSARFCPFSSSSLTASSKDLASASAFLQSTKPAPVTSRSLATSFAVASIITVRSSVQLLAASPWCSPSGCSYQRPGGTIVSRQKALGVHPNATAQAHKRAAHRAVPRAAAGCPPPGVQGQAYSAPAVTRPLALAPAAPSRPRPPPPPPLPPPLAAT